MTEPFEKFLTQLITNYLQTARKSFQKRMDCWEIDLIEKEINEVVGGLLARQLSLATNVAIIPQGWNSHLLPIVLRCMAEVYITFSWITIDVKNRSRQFIEYGLGQEKLAIEVYREVLSDQKDTDLDAEEYIDARAERLNEERASFFIPVNLGAWSETNLRKMAIEAGEKTFYDLVFTQFSSAVHSTWQHIWQMNLRPCKNPFHMGHRVPFDPNLPLDPRIFVNSAKYLCMTFARFDKAILNLDEDSDAYECHNLLCDNFDNYYGQNTTT